MEPVNELIPKNKFDIGAIERLERLTDEQTRPLIGSLLEWLQDMNWPIAESVLSLIVKHQDIAIPHIKAIFHSDDWIWIYWLLSRLVPLLSEANMRSIKGDLAYLASLESADEETVDIVAMAKVCLASHFALCDMDVAGELYD